jgi:hypothetical protein
LDRTRARLWATSASRRLSAQSTATARSRRRCLRRPAPSRCRHYSFALTWRGVWGSRLTGLLLSRTIPRGLQTWRRCVRTPLSCINGVHRFQNLIARPCRKRNSQFSLHAHFQPNSVQYTLVSVFNYNFELKSRILNIREFVSLMQGGFSAPPPLSHTLATRSFSGAGESSCTLASFHPCADRATACDSAEVELLFRGCVAFYCLTWPRVEHASESHTCLVVIQHHPLFNRYNSHRLSLHLKRLQTIIIKFITSEDVIAGP